MLTILSGALILLAALTLSVGGLALVYRFVPVSLLQAHYGATGAIYAALYVMYGISLGFALFLVCQQYEAARLTVVVVLLLFTIGVLDHAYDGDVRVGPRAFELALQEMKQ